MKIRRQQVQLYAGEQTTAFASTDDLARTLSALANYEAKKGAEEGEIAPGTEKYHLARREAFLEALQIVSPA